jgi:hypothetical protein
VRALRLAAPFASQCGLAGGRTTRISGVFSYSQAAFDYEPYPVCLAPKVLAESDYEELTRTYPDVALFDYKPALGDKYSLSERNNRENYQRFLDNSPAWARVHAYIKSRRFIDDTLGFLESRNVDLGLKPYAVRSTTGKAKPSLASRIARTTELSARFEFSIMGGQGGHILPHADEPKKLVTLVISMIRPGEWDNAWGGGTQVCLPKDRTLIFNRVNRYLEFDQVDVIRNYEFNANQCLLFIKTYNSWHQVSPIHAPPGAPMRKTLTINIERLS